MLTIHVWPKRLKEFLLTHPLYKSPQNPSYDMLDFSFVVFVSPCPPAPCEGKESVRARHGKCV